MTMRQGIHCGLLLWKATYDADTGGRVIFEISKEEIEPFFGLPTKKGGQRFAAVLVLIGDDEMPIPIPSLKPATEAKAPEPAVSIQLPNQPESLKPAAEPKPRPPATDAQKQAMAGRCGLAIKWCADPHFHEWLAFTFMDEWALVPCGPKGRAQTDAESAEWVLKRICKIESRKELDTQSGAALRFDALIRQPYAACRLEDKVDG